MASITKHERTHPAGRGAFRETLVVRHDDEPIRFVVATKQLDEGGYWTRIHVAMPGEAIGHPTRTDVPHRPWVADPAQECVPKAAHSMDSDDEAVASEMHEDCVDEIVALLRDEAVNESTTPTPKPTVTAPAWIAVRRGDLVLACIPTEKGPDEEGADIDRVVLVIQNERGNLNSRTIIGAALEPMRYRRMHQPTQVDIPEDDRLMSGLRDERFVNTGNLSTVSKGRILKVLGTLSARTMQDVDDALLKSLQLD